MRTTESIINRRPVMTKKGKRIILTTSTGHEIWVTEEQYEPSATEVTFEPHKAGDDVVALKDGEGYKKGDTIKLKQDNNQFLGFDKLVIRESFEAKMTVLQRMGITPTFSLSA